MAGASTLERKFYDSISSRIDLGAEYLPLDETQTTRKSSSSRKKKNRVASDFKKQGQSNPQEEPIATPKKKCKIKEEPQVINFTFDDGGRQEFDISEKKRFMETKCSKFLNSKKTIQDQSNDQLDAEERESLLKDKELEQLIKTHELIKEYNELHTTGKERRKLLEKKAWSIGAFKKPHHPREVRLGLHRASVKRFNKRLEEARLQGLYNPKYQKDPVKALGLDPYDYTFNPKNKENKRSRSLAPNVGTYSRGILRINKDTLDRINSK